MPVRSFDADAREATATSLPIPRGIAFRFDAPAGAQPTIETVQAATAGSLRGWTIVAVPELPGWFEAAPTARRAAQPIPLGEFWNSVHTLKNVPGVGTVDPLFLIAKPQPDGALGFGQDQFGLWGWPYDDATQKAIDAERGKNDWHLSQLNVRNAWTFWMQEHPGGVPGDGILVGHPDTGYTDHPELTGRFQLPGRSFLPDEVDARDDLIDVGGLLPKQPGHGTATASIIASNENDSHLENGVEILGVAPGARVLPLRVSRSVIHLDFSNLAHAILEAVAENVDVISMSLGGPAESTFLRECIGKALDQGTIVVAAAGNEIPTVMFPAAFPEVVAVAATHAGKAPWRFTGLGRVVDIAAPGEDVWCARSRRDTRQAPPTFATGQGTGTSFATACVAGLAALWLSHHGGRTNIAHQQYGGQLRLVPFAFQYVLARTANNNFEFVRHGKYGAGIADADKLLREPLPDQVEVERFAEVIGAQPVHHLSAVTGLLSGLLGVTDRPAVTLTAEATIDAVGTPMTGAVEETDAVKRAVEERDAEKKLLARFFDSQNEPLEDEFLARVAADRVLLVGLQRWRPGESLLPLFDRLLTPSSAAPSDGQSVSTLSDALRTQLIAQREKELQTQNTLHRGKLEPPVVRADETTAGPPAPAYRLLRAYAFDPSQATKLETSPISQVTIPARWEQGLKPGPVGEYLEVVDVDPASGCAYSPVDLNHPHILAQDGLAPSEGVPQFHQQMVYAVAMNTIHRFEMALGRPIFWAPIRPWLDERPEEKRYYTPEAFTLTGFTPTPEHPVPKSSVRDRYVQRLRLYPHALREANAYYSPQKRALLFGYFPGSEDDSGKHFPGGMVFTCLSHDIIAHETTHALLDGMHPFFNEPSNDDVWAFHEAFADIMALFQHFTYPEVLRHQIAHTRGNLETDNLLGQLAQQFGQSTGGHGALRDALGQINEATGKWERNDPDPQLLHGRREPHDRGSILVAAVFDAFLALYNDRVTDLLRIASGGTGELPAGQLHPDLVNRLATEAAQTAEEVLRICIRAMDYVPPVDITFGEFLRALITADYDLAPTAQRRNRIAFIEAFRSWGIYPRDVSTLSEDSLRWHGPDGDAPLTNLNPSGDAEIMGRFENQTAGLVPALESWQPGSNRGNVFRHILRAQSVLHDVFKTLQKNSPGGRPVIPGLDLRDGAHFSIGNLRPARRIGLLGDFRTEMVLEVVQTFRPEDEEPQPDQPEDDDAVPKRGGATLVVDLRNWDIRYIIYKRLFERLPDDPAKPTRSNLSNRFKRRDRYQQRMDVTGQPQGAWQGETGGGLTQWLADTYNSPSLELARKKKTIQQEPFALLHRNVD